MEHELCVCLIDIELQFRTDQMLHHVNSSDPHTVVAGRQRFRAYVGPHRLPARRPDNYRPRSDGRID